MLRTECRLYSGHYTKASIPEIELPQPLLANYIDKCLNLGLRQSQKDCQRAVKVDPDSTIGLVDRHSIDHAANGIHRHGVDLWISQRL